MQCAGELLRARRTCQVDTSTLHEQHVLQRHTSAFITTYFVRQTLMRMQRSGIARANASMLCTLVLMLLWLGMLYMPLWLGMLTSSTSFSYCKLAILQRHTSQKSQLF